MPVAVGDKFSRLVILGKVGFSNGRTRWECQCECGNRVEVRADKLLSGRTKSCGCLRDELTVDAHVQKVAVELPEWEKQKQEVATCLRKLKSILLIADRLSSRILEDRLRENLGEGFEETLNSFQDKLKFHREGNPYYIATVFKTWAEVLVDILKAGPDKDQICLDVNFYRKSNPSDDGVKESSQ